MSFNALMALLVHSVVDGLGDKPTVMELGNQTLKADDGALNAILERSKAQGLDQVDSEGLRALITQGAESRTTTDWLDSLTTRRSTSMISMAASSWISTRNSVPHTTTARPSTS